MYISIRMFDRNDRLFRIPPNDPHTNSAKKHFSSSVFNFNWVLLLSLGNGSHVYLLSKTMQFPVILSDNFRQFVIECVVVFRFSLAVQFLFVSAKRYWHNIRIFPFCYVYVRSCCVGGLAILELPQIVNTHVSIFLVQNTDNKMLNKHVDVAENISF